MAGTFFQCDDALWQRFTALCQAQDETPGAVLRNLVRLEVKRHASRKVRSDEVIDEQLLVRLRLLVAEALAEAENWPALQAALRQRGLRFDPSGGGLSLKELATGAALAKSSDVGPAYLSLVRRFKTGFPGHPRPGLAAQALAQYDPRLAAPPSGARGSAGGPAR